MQYLNLCKFEWVELVSASGTWVRPPCMINFYKPRDKMSAEFISIKRKQTWFGLDSDDQVSLSHQTLQLGLRLCLINRAVHTKLGISLLQATARAIKSLKSPPYFVKGERSTKRLKEVKHQGCWSDIPRSSLLMLANICLLVLHFVFAMPKRTLISLKLFTSTFAFATVST